MNIEKITNELCDKLINFNNKHNRNILELIDELLDNKYKKYKKDILVLLPSILAEKGYVIKNSDFFELEKY